MTAPTPDPTPVLGDLRAPILLVALPQVMDPHFHRSVVLIVRHDEEGSLGFIINRSTELRIEQVLADLELLDVADDLDAADDVGDLNEAAGLEESEPASQSSDAQPEAQPEATDEASAAGKEPASGERVYYGGPVSPQLGSVFFSTDGAGAKVSGEGVVEVLPGVAMTQQIADLDQLSRTPPRHLRLYQGCAGWGEEQLMEEILRNDWLTVPASQELIFSDQPDDVWERAVRAVGIDPRTLPSWTLPSDADAAN